MAKTTRGETETVRRRQLTTPATCVLVATLLGAAFPSSTKAEAVVPTPPARPDSLILSVGAAPPQRDAPGVFVYTPSAPPSLYQSVPYAPSGGSLVAPRAATVATVTGVAASHAEPAALRAWARPAEWAMQGGVAALLYGLSRRGGRRRRRGRKRIGW